MTLKLDASGAKGTPSISDSKSIRGGEIGRGVGLAAGAYVIWGLVPLFWKQIQQVPASEIMVFRIVMTVVFAFGLLAWMGRLAALTAILRNRKAMVWLTGTALLIGVNWWIFIWAVNDGRILETSLGYFINPLMSIFLGVLVLGERLNRLQQFAVALAAIGVVHQAIAVGVAPWVSLSLAATFAVYGLMRKQVDVNSIDGLLVETTLIVPIAIGYAVWLYMQGDLRFPTETHGMQGLLLLAGPVTAIPLLLFASAVRLVRLSTMGFLQYIAPTLTMLTAVFIYSEPFTSAHGVTFGLIWAALALISYDLLRRDHSAA